MKKFSLVFDAVQAKGMIKGKRTKCVECAFNTTQQCSVEVVALIRCRTKGRWGSCIGAGISHWKVRVKKDRT